MNGVPAGKRVNIPSARRYAEVGGVVVLLFPGRPLEDEPDDVEYPDPLKSMKGIHS